MGALELSLQSKICAESKKNVLNRTITMELQFGLEWGIVLWALILDTIDPLWASSISPFTFFCFNPIYSLAATPLEAFRGTLE